MHALRHRYRVIREVPGPRPVAVFRAHDRVLDIEVAIKTTPAEHDLADELVQEGLRHHALRHPGLVPVTSRFGGLVGFDARTVVGFATRWIVGPTLVAWRHGRADLERLAAIAELTRTLDWLHRRGWLHLDLKPDNVLVHGDRPVLIDLGTALPLGAGSSTAGGTLGYAAPEVVAGEAPDVSSDLYSVGVLLFEVLTGERPFLEEGSELRQAVLQGRPRRIQLLRPDLPRGLVELVDALLSPSAPERPARAAEVVQALEALGAPKPPGELPLGEAPLTDRDDAIRSLQAAADGGGDTPIVVLGPHGLGRERLAREHLARQPVGEGRWCLDLTLAPDGAETALTRLLKVLGAPGGGAPDDPRLATWQASKLGGDVYLGRWAPALQVRRPAIDALARAGLTMWTTAEQVAPGFRVVAPVRLPAASLRAIAVWHGLVEHPRSQQAVDEADGRVGRFFERLTAPEVDPAAFPPALRQVWPLLAALPGRVTGAVVASLEPELATGWSEAVQLGLYRSSEGVSAPVVRIEPPAVGDIPERLHRFGARLLALDELGYSEAERAVLAARTGHWEPARAWLSGFHYDHHLRPDVREVAERLAGQGDRHAIWILGIALASERQLDQVARVLRAMPEHDPRHAIVSTWHLRFDRESPRAHQALMDWLQVHGDEPVIRGEALYCLTTCLRYTEAVALAREWQADPDIDDGFLRADGGWAGLLSALANTIDAPGHRDWLEQLVDGWTERRDSVVELPNRLLHMLGKALLELGDEQGAIAAGEALVLKSDLLGQPEALQMSRRRHGGMLMDYNRADEARRYLLESLGLAEQNAWVEEQVFCHAMLAEIEVGCRRFPATLRHLRAFDALLPQSNRLGATGVRRSCILWASYHLGRREPDKAVRLLSRDDHDWDSEEPMVRTWRALVLMEAYNDLQAFDEAMRIADSLSAWPSPNVVRRVQIAKGRAHLGLARSHLGDAVTDLPEDPDPMVRGTVGQALLAAGGEDLDPGSFGRRRDQLQRATSFLDGEHRARAVALRERLLEGPGAALGQIVSLIEAVGDGERMLETIAQVVSDALGANRVLIMLRMPGLGRQLTAREISGQESAGLAPEIWRRVRRPGDVWLAEDAFADPNLRRMSATVRTFEIKSVVAVAIPREGQVIGALYVDDVHRKGRFGPADVQILQRLASAIGAVAEVLPARKIRDGLTVHDLHGLYTCDGELADNIERTLERAASTDQVNLLLSGPTGSGKTWLARRVATEVLGLDGLVEVVMHPGPTEMLVSQLWGTRRGDFTGAVERQGAIFQAWRQNAALFLDELQNLDEVGQRVLLPLLELPKRRFGSLTSGVQELDRPLHVIVGTNAVLEHGAWSQVFREDLWYRISPVRVDLPPLSDRGREAVYRHLEDLLKERGLPAPEDVFQRDALQRMATHPWPGNLRTLGNVSEQAALRFRSDGRPIPAADLDNLGLQPPPEPERRHPTGNGEAPALLNAQARAVLDALDRHDYVQAAAADELGLSKYALHRKLKKLDLIEHVREQRHLRKRLRDGA